MRITIPFLIAVMIISITFGSATALVIPVDFSTTDNVKLYTVKDSIEVTSTIGTFEITLFCDDGDTLVSAYPQKDEGTTGFGTFISIKTPTAEGAIVRLTIIEEVPQVMTAVIVCGKIVPMMTVGGLLLEPDTTALLLAYGVVNAFWLAPTVAGIGIGVYLVKRRF